ncbi:MAG: hypothetical protein QS748_01960 [Candidatus Endonucleobacter bathymodioli]|uniref:Uncharacterized protein n=1 Tax=Candidatus Endonucleibacter bathymodioli TaxID=539814 RepID=A0AA90NRM9_9GAMM|nr:hypothetical protein [Candidatus Endonucleobacter bathymodioli]
MKCRDSIYGSVDIDPNNPQKEIIIDEKELLEKKLMSMICVDLPATIPAPGQVAATSVVIEGYSAIEDEKPLLLHDAINAVFLQFIDTGPDLKRNKSLIWGYYKQPSESELADKINKLGYKHVIYDKLNKTSFPKLLAVILPEGACVCQFGVTIGKGKAFTAEMALGVRNPTGAVFISSD